MKSFRKELVIHTKERYAIVRITDQVAEALTRISHNCKAWTSFRTSIKDGGPGVSRFRNKTW